MVNEEQVKTQFAKNLTELRKSRSLTQLQLAQELNYSDKAVSKWERGESIPDAVTLLNISKFFDVSLNALLDGSCHFKTAEEAKAGPQAEISKNKQAKHVFIPLISAFGTYFAASIVFFVFKNIPSVQEYAVFAFQYATVAAFIVLTVFSSLWWQRIWQCICVSGIIWSVGFCMVYPQFMENFKFFLVPCAILQCICILVYIFAYFLSKEKHNDRK